MKLLELFDKSAKYRMVLDTDLCFRARFTVGDRDIVFNADLEDDGDVPYWSIVFFEKKKDNKSDFSMTNSGGEFEVMSTVKKLVGEFIARHDPEEFEFTASDSEPSRQKLYTRMTSAFAPPNYDKSISRRTLDEITFSFTKKKPT